MTKEKEQKLIKKVLTTDLPKKSYVPEYDYISKEAMKVLNKTKPEKRK